MKNKYKNTHCEAIHSAAFGLHKAGVINDDEMRHFDDSCLVKPAIAVPRLSTKKPPIAARSGAPVYVHGK